MPQKWDAVYCDALMNNYFVIYNPRGTGGVIILDADALSLLHLCDGKTTIDRMSDKLQIDKDIISNAITKLARIDLIKVEDSNETKSIAKKIDCWLHLTNDCNLKCSYCYIDKSKTSMSIHTAKNAIEIITNTAREHGYTEIQLRFSGGEPLLRFSLLCDIIEYTKGKYSEFIWRYVILTNGTLIDDNIAHYIKEKKIGVSISLDGTEEYNTCRQDIMGNSSFDKVICGIETLQKHGTKAGIMTTVSEHNLYGLPALTKFFIMRGMTFRFSLEKNIVTGNTSLFRNLSEVNRIMTECINIMNSFIDSGMANFHFKFGDIVFNHPSKRVCGAGNNSFAIGHLGELGLCGMGLIYPLSTINEISDLWELRQKGDNNICMFSVEQVEACSNCIWRYCCANGCPMQNQATNHNLVGLSPYCFVYKSILPQYIKMLGKKMLVESKALINEKLDNL